MQNTMRACLFGGAIFSAGVADAQEFQWVQGQGHLLGHTTRVGTFINPGDGTTASDSQINYTPVPAYASASVSGFVGAAACAPTSIWATSQAGPPGPGGFGYLDAMANAYFTVSAPTMAHAEWDFTNASTSGGPTTGIVVLYVNEPVTWDEIAEPIEVIHSPVAGSLTIELLPDYIYQFGIRTDGTSPGGSSSGSLTILNPCLADCDGSGTLNLDDIDCFVTGFLAGDTTVADCDANGTINLDDLDCFVASFLGGCP